MKKTIITLLVAGLICASVGSVATVYPSGVPAVPAGWYPAVSPYQVYSPNERVMGLSIFDPLRPRISAVVNDKVFKIRLVSLTDSEAKNRIRISPNATGTALQFAESLMRHDDGTVMLMLRRDMATENNFGIYASVDSLTRLRNEGVAMLGIFSENTFAFSIDELLNAAKQSGSTEILIMIRKVDPYEVADTSITANSNFYSVDIYRNDDGLRTKIDDNISMYATIKCNISDPSLIMMIEDGVSSKLQTQLLIERDGKSMSAKPTRSLPAGSIVGVVKK